MSNIIPLTYNTKQVRVIEKDGEPWFVAKDVCDILEISNGRDAASKLDDDIFLTSCFFFIVLLLYPILYHMSILLVQFFKKILSCKTIKSVYLFQYGRRCDVCVSAG